MSTHLVIRTADHRYEMLEPIATGGMGEVWRARDTTLDRDVAVKQLLPAYAGDAASRTRFLAEARNAAGLLHPGIAAVFDYGERDTDGRSVPYLVMEYVDGRPLSELLAEAPEGTGLDPEAAADLVGQAAVALGVAHRQGLVHRDVKPANLMVTPAGRVKVTDFGIARAADAAPLTVTGQVVGTPQYLSPEQAQGEPVTPASDVYGLGVVLFECLTGSRPFDRDNPVGTALAHLRDPVPALPERVPRRLAEVTRTALAKDPGQRYADGDRFATALREAALGGGTMLPAGPPPVAATTAETPAGTTRRRLPAWWPLTLLAALALAVLVAVRDGGSGSATAPDTPSSTPSARTAVLVNGSRYVGMDAARAGRLLRDLGLRPQAVTVANHGSHRPGTVAGVSPTGRVPLRQAVTVRSWGPRPAPHRSGEKAEPPQPPKHSKPGKHAPGKHGHHDKPGHGGDTGKQNGKGHHD